MHATERSRVSTCSTDNGSSHAHEDTRLTTVVSNLSTISSSSPKNKSKDTDPAVSVSTSDTHALTASAHTQPQAGTTNAASSPSVAPTHLVTLLTTTGQRTSWRFDPNQTVEVVRAHIWDNWPQAWPQPKPESAAYLRLLHLGHILDNPATTLASRGCRSGATTVVHVIVRSIPPPEPVKVEQQNPVKDADLDAPPTRRNPDQQETPGCSCVIC
ncbi:hypothetical protein EX895_001503 [Sporisorium graminicola]|uniref:UBL3-like ubiquitin domain-containing protein n=1 Tax=Sporisorium graminicola TaxID=280036 RepID=A0A4U7L1R0_9BASI|nr:hypothetical protein EX895_001503 [Sporisorium graminicola]TKY89718.1 hypothetical protein EX895_001503 [Sporisorium graminicola]